MKTSMYASVKIIQLNEWRCRDAPCEKWWKQEVPLAILSRILAQSCVTPLPELCREGLHMIVLVSLIVLLRELLVSTMFLMVHPYIAIHSVK